MSMSYQPIVAIAEIEDRIDREDNRGHKKRRE